MLGYGLPQCGLPLAGRDRRTNVARSGRSTVPAAARRQARRQSGDRTAACPARLAPHRGVARPPRSRRARGRRSVAGVVQRRARSGDSSCRYVGARPAGEQAAAARVAPARDADVGCGAPRSALREPPRRARRALAAGRRPVRIPDHGAVPARCRRASAVCARRPGSGGPWTRTVPHCSARSRIVLGGRSAAPYRSLSTRWSCSRNATGPTVSELSGATRIARIPLGYELPASPQIRREPIRTRSSPSAASFTSRTSTPPIGSREDLPDCE